MTEAVQTMEEIAGYARMLARARVQQERTKPFLRTPFLRYGQCFALAGYFFQLGAILAAKHRENCDAFGHAFLGLRGEPGAVGRFFSTAVERVLALLNEPTMSIDDYVRAEQIKRLNYSGDPQMFFSEHGMQKIDPQTVAEVAWQFASEGATLGAVHADVARRMFEQTHRPPKKEDWDLARAAGLNIPAEPDLKTYEEVEEGENEEFMEYCRVCCPSLHLILAR